MGRYITQKEEEYFYIGFICGIIHTLLVIWLIGYVL